MRLFIENNSTYGDVIIMAVRGTTSIKKHLASLSHPIYDALRSLGVDRIDNCTLQPGCKKCISKFYYFQNC